jgi:acetyl-CoA carboxylase biotin carboxylase subunit
MERALEMFILEGVKTSIPLHRLILRNEEFRRGNLSTKFLEFMQHSLPKAEIA